MIGSILLEPVFYGVGWLYLKIRLRDPEKMKKEKFKNYYDSYSTAGKIVCLNVIYILFGLMLLGFWLVGIYGVIRGAIR